MPLVIKYLFENRGESFQLSTVHPEGSCVLFRSYSAEDLGLKFRNDRFFRGDASEIELTYRNVEFDDRRLFLNGLRKTVPQCYSHFGKRLEH